VHTRQGLVLELHRLATSCSVGRAPTRALLRFASELLAITLPRQSLFGSALITRLQIEGVLLDVLDDVFLLNLPLEPTKGTFDRLALLNLDFSHALHTPFIGLVATCDGPLLSAEHARLAQAGADSRRN